MGERIERLHVGALGWRVTGYALLSAGIAAMATAGVSATQSADAQDLAEIDPPQCVSRQYAVILRQGEHGRRQVRLARGLDRHEFEEKHKKLEKDYVLEDFEIIEEGAEPRFSGVWHRSEVHVKQHLGLELSQGELVQENTARRTEGWYPVDIETYLEGQEGTSRRLFAGLWVEDVARQNHELALADEAEQIQAIAQDQYEKRAVVDVESWLAARGRRYLAVHRPRSASTVTLLDRSFEAYYAIVNGLIATGYRPLELEIEGDADGAEARYSATWEKAEDDFWLFTALDGPGPGQAGQDCRLVSLGVGDPSELTQDLPTCCQTLGQSATSDPDEPAAPAQSALETRSPTAREESGPTVCRSDAEHGCCGLHEREDSLPHDSLPHDTVHIVDFVVTRHLLVDPIDPDCRAHHEGVLHDEGPTVP